MTMNELDSSTTRRLVRQWLAAERGGADDDAQAGLAALFALQSPVHPEPGFADRVLRRLMDEAVLTASAASGATADGGRLRRSIPLELVAAALFLFTVLALRLAPYWLTPIMSRIQIPTWPARIWQVCMGFGSAATELLGAVAGSTRFSQLILTSPQGVALVASCVAVAMLSARLLYGLLERSTDDV